MGKMKRLFLSAVMGVIMLFSLCFGIVLSIPMKTAKAESLSTTGWTLATEGDYAFRIQNGNTYWNANTNFVTTESILDYSEINGKTLSEINAEYPGAITVTLQPAGGTIGSFYRVSINANAWDFTINDLGTFVVRAGWSHTDDSGTYTIDTDLYFAHAQNEWGNWRYIPATNVVDISDNLQLEDQGTKDVAGTRSILLKTSNNNYWGGGTPNEGGGSFLNTLYVNGKSVRDWNKEAHAALEAGEITDIAYGSSHGTIANNKGAYAPIFVQNSAPESLGSIVQTWIPTGYISDVSSFKVEKGFANLQGDTLYYVSKDVEYVKSGAEFIKVASSVDISDAFKILVQDYTASNGTMLYYLHTNDVEYWVQNYGVTGAYAINEKEWKGEGNVDKQGGAVQMSYLEFNGTPIYDINASDNGSYGATQGNIASGSKYAPILAFVTSEEKGNSIKLQIPTKYPSDSGTAADNHKTITIKKGFYVVDTTTNIKYEVNKDIQWDFEDGVWSEHVEKIETNVTMAKLVTDGNSFFGAISLEGSDYNKAPSTYAGDVQTAKSFAQSANFLSHVLIDDELLKTPGEAFLNVWSNFGYFTFRPGNNNATKITILAGCQFPTYKALLTGAKEVYVTTEDVTFVKNSSGEWVKDEGGLKPGEYETSISAVTYARDNKNNWMMFTLTEKDYPNAGETYNIATTEEQMSKLNLYDKITVDGYTLRSRIATYGSIEVPKINLWQSNCLGIRIAGCPNGEGLDAINGAKKVVIKAGAQFPSYAYITEDVEAYYVTTENVTFVNVGADNGNWEREYTATFKADGVTVEKVPYTESEGLTAPEVPEKEGYRGVWESYTANGNITVNAVYTKNPTVLGTTGIQELRNIDTNNAVFVIKPTISDYPASVEGSWNLGLDVSHLQKFNLLDYITINGKTLREIGVTEMAINKWTRPGLGLTTTLSDNMTVVIKEGCEIPSYAFWKNPNGEASCYTVDNEYTAVYSAGGESAFVITSEAKAPTDFEDHYILSDLYTVGYGKTAVFQDGIETLARTDGSETDYRYGHIDSNSFTLSFDFKYSEANWYETFAVMFGTDGYNSVKACFGWRFFLLRGSDEDGISPSQCVQFFSGCDKGSDTHGNLAAPAINGTYFVAGQTYRVTIGYKLMDADTVLTYVSIDGTELAKAQYDLVNAHDTYGKFSSYSSYMDTISFYKENNGGTVTISDPGQDMTVATYHKLILKDREDSNQEILANSYVLPALNPAEYGMAGNVFVGWTDNTTEFTNLYPAGYELTLTENTTLYPVWLKFKMRNGAAVRTKIDGGKNESGIRFIVDTNKATVESLSWIKEMGTILAPTDYLTKAELTHDLGNGKFANIVMTQWQEKSPNTYSAAFINIPYDQYARSFSARGYMKIEYTTGEGYIYTAYDANEHARSIYGVATAAYNNNERPQAVINYVNTVADITVDDSFKATKTGDAVGSYKVSTAISGRTITITVDKEVKAVVINGVRIVMGEETNIIIGGASYALEAYLLNNNGLTFTFKIADGEGNVAPVKKYYESILKGYLNSTAYTAEHKAIVDELANEGLLLVNGNAWSEIDAKIAKIETIKTAEELAANNTGDDSDKLAAPTLSKGLGYTVTWTAVANADYYVVSDDNNYRERVVVMANEPLSYKAEVVGNHNITVTAHSYYEKHNSAKSNKVATPEVKPVFSYKSMLDGLYKFSSSQMSTMGISTTGCYYDSSDKKYFVYYNKETGWSPDGAKATDWTSPAEFPAHAQRLKDMGNNIILLARDTNAEYKANDTWEASRLRYIMDTAWSMGMKVLVCDEVFYKLSMTDEKYKDEWATSKEQVTAAINARNGFKDYVTHPAFYGFSLDDEPYYENMDAMVYTISALDEACADLGVEEPFYLACLFQSYGSDNVYTGKTLYNYYKKWLSISGVDNKYLYVDIYTQHAMDYPLYSVTNRYENSFDAVYGDGTNQLNLKKNNYKFYQAITSHTQNDGTLSEADLYMSLLYAAAHNVSGYSWFCYFPIAGELAGSMVGYDGNGYGNGIGNKASGSYYNAAKTAGYQFELIQGLLDGYNWKTRKVSGNLLTTTLSNGTKTATMYVNADEDNMKDSVTVTASGSECYLVGYQVGTAEAPYQAVSGSVTLAPGQAVICIN